MLDRQVAEAAREKSTGACKIILALGSQCVRFSLVDGDEREREQMSKVVIAGGGIVISGEGGGVQAQEIQRVRGLIVKLFHAQPVISLKGFFAGEAIRPTVVGGKIVSPDRMPLSASGAFYPVLFVGRHYVDVQLESGLNEGRALGLVPGLGTAVKVRFSLPE